MVRRRLNRTFFQKLWRRVRYLYLRVILLPDTPRSVALGLAAGVFAGMLPIIPFQTLAALAVAWPLGGSKIAAAVGTWVTNPITVPPLYAAFYYLGRALTPFGYDGPIPQVETLKDFLEMGTDLALAGLVGGLVFAVILAPLTYFLVFRYIDRLQAWEREKASGKVWPLPAEFCLNWGWRLKKGGARISWPIPTCPAAS